MKIYVVGSSKNKFLPLDDIREKFLIDEKHEGDNIDFLNPWYCELTGLYYLWKHVDDDIVGLEHYRRYFVNSKNKLLSESEIREILKDNDVICKKWVFKEHNETCTLTPWIRGGNLHYLIDFVNKIDDIQLKNFINEKLKTNPYLYQCNMFIAKKEIIDKYCNWFFDICFNLKSIEFKNHDRGIGFIAEALFGLWLEYNNHKIISVKTNVYDKNLIKIIPNG